VSDIRQLVSTRLKALRKDHTQGELAERAGVSVDVIGKIERGETTPSLETLHRLCKALRVSLAEFFAFEAESKDVSEAIERLRLYLSTRSLDHIQFADKMVRQIIERLEAEQKVHSTKRRSASRSKSRKPST
jgi:transcriptional regulator with XRE-family HTH domain